MAGNIAAQIGNYAGKQLKENVHLSPSDFMPSSRHRATQTEPSKRINRTLVANQVRAFFDRAMAIQNSKGIVERE